MRPVRLPPARRGRRSRRSLTVVALALTGVALPGTADAQVDALPTGDTVTADATADGGTAAPDLQPDGTLAPPAAVAPTPAEETHATVETDVVDMLSAIKGQELSDLDLEALLDNVVVTATKSAMAEDRAPAITTVVSREEIQRWGYQSIDEVLRHVAGVYVVNDHIIPNLAVRGISGGLRSESGLVKVMIDGHSVAFRSTAGNWLGPELIPLSAVQQIEIIRGPVSSLYGADAFLGVINVVTRRPDQMQGGEIGLVAHHEGGNTWGQDIAVGASAGSWQLLAALRTSAENRSGLELPASSPAPKLPGYAPTDLRANEMNLDSTVALAKASYAFGRRASLTLTGYYSEIERAAEFADWEQLTHNLDGDGRRNGTNILLHQGTLGMFFEAQATPTLELRLGGLGFYGGPSSRDRIEVGSDLFYVRRDFGYRGFDAGAEAAWRPRDDVSVLVGADMILDDEKLPNVYDVLKTSLGTGPGERAGDEVLASAAMGSKTLSNVGANALVMWSPRAWLTFTGGLRYDHHSVYGDKASGRLSGVAVLHDTLTLKLLYGSAFKAPSPQLLYGSPLMPGDIAGNEQLKPSYVHTVEAQLSWRPHRYLVLKSGVAYSYLLDQAAFAQRGINEVALNMSRVGSLSWETEVRFDYRRRVAAYANLTVNHTVVRLNEDNYAADLSGYANAAYPTVVTNGGASAQLPLLPIRASVELSFVSQRRSSMANTLENGGEYALPAYALLGACLRTTDLHLLSGRQTTLVLVVRNLTDVRYADPGFAGIDYPQLGRTSMVQAIQEF
jgi:outer membrane receptor for ferrienterochelin and colicins